MYETPESKPGERNEKTQFLKIGRTMRRQAIFFLVLVEASSFLDENDRFESDPDLDLGAGNIGGLRRGNLRQGRQGMNV